MFARTRVDVRDARCKGSRAGLSRRSMLPLVETIERRRLLSADVLTYHNTNDRVGANNAETALTQSAVSSGKFGKLFTTPLDGVAFAQPLYERGVVFRGIAHDTAYVATEHDSVYAIDAHTGKVLWRNNFLDAGHGVTTVPTSDLGVSDQTLEIGITGTPVIDGTTGLLYVVGKMKQVSGGNTRYVQRLFAIDVHTGGVSMSMGINGSVAIPGTTGRTYFDPKLGNQRAALLLDHGRVYVAEASHGDNGPYHGWLFAYDAATLKPLAVFDTTPGGVEGSIWQGGAGPSADAAGNVYVGVGNGTFAGGINLGQTVLKLSYSSAAPSGASAANNGGPGTLAVVDSFTPADERNMSIADQDLASDGVVLLPDQPGAHPHEMVVGDKLGNVYLIDRDHLGGFNSSGNADVQTIRPSTRGMYATVSYFNGTVYVSEQGDPLRAYKLVNGQFPAAPTSQSTLSFAYPGSSVSVSSNGTRDGIVWGIDRFPISGGGESAVLVAYDANNLGHVLYQSPSDPTAADYGGVGVKFCPPTIANGQVLVGTTTGLSVYGLK